jgi:hypothetical protein
MGKRHGRAVALMLSAVTPTRGLLPPLEGLQILRMNSPVTHELHAAEFA